MIYLSSDVQGSAPQSLEFQQRNLKNLTVGTVSTITIHARADHNQVAFAGYKSNIEAFLCATASKSRVSISAGCFPIPPEYVYSMPLQLPKTIFRLARPTPGEDLKKMEKGLDEFGLRSVFLGKGNPGYIIDRPQSRHALQILPALSLSKTGVSDGCCQVESLYWALRLYQFADLFLATNTYSYKPGEELDSAESATIGGGGYNAELRHDKNYYMSTGHNQKDVTEEGDERTKKKRRTSKEETTDLTPGLVHMANPKHMVLVAKPSPKPSRTSWGPPSDVPFSSGLCFPYFPGMLKGDVAGLRSLAADLFMRNMGSSKTSFRDGFREFRQSIHSFAYTTQGIIMSHLLTGFKLALDSQTHCYALFDQTSYLGFCLLGESFEVFAHGGWHRSKSPDDLRDDLDTIQTHDLALVALAEKLNGLRVQTEGAEASMEAWTSEDINTPIRLANVLAYMEIKESSDVSEVTRLMSYLTLPSRFRTFKPDNLSWAIQQLTISYNEPLPVDLPIYVPISGWTPRLATKEYQVLASFGPRSFSFRNTSGVEFRIPREGETDPFTERNEDGKLKFDTLLVMEKPILEAVSNWEQLTKKASIKMDLKERAGPSRNHVFRGKELETIWRALKEAVKEKKMGNERDNGGESLASTSKRSANVAFGSGSIGDFF